ncbi:nuclear transport factor 2 family protein [Maritalea porphyrae]|uniref:nuclear transport factor 2 family protein n=1 Tax=Maritalea porphyrae TaxID=880732 RepID=UPI0022AEED43|nr:nuclear transport factor 2 family protein [Maritalea porphyrae]MCZ4271529.1 nuclear transport factor 2 family protein [Maritalea porphyrae]
MNQHQDLLDAVSIYLDAIYYCDVEKLDKVFHPASSLFDADEGKIFVDPIASFRADVASRPSPASINQKRKDEIITIDWLSPISATVKLRLHAHDNVFADHLALVLGENGWQIVSKVWRLEGKTEIEYNE